MGLVFFSSLAMACGGALLKRVRDRRKFLRRYAERIAALVESNDEIQAHFRKNPKALVARERRLCGKEVSVELVFIADENAISIAVSDTFCDSFLPVTVRVKQKLPNGN